MNTGHQIPLVFERGALAYEQVRRGRVITKLNFFSAGCPETSVIRLLSAVIGETRSERCNWHENCVFAFDPIEFS